MLEAFHSHLNDTLGLNIECRHFGGDIHLSPEERSTDEIGRPYWLLMAGGKDDFPTKVYSASRLQAVVDQLQGEVQFVQVGKRGEDGQIHTQPPLRGVIDKVNQTSLRDLVRLTHHAQGVLCGVTLMMHLAAAVPTKPGHPSQRPAVITAGGREPPHWVAYPGHQFLHTQSMLKCCSSGGCWKNKVVSLGGDKSLCVLPTREPDGSPLPKCMAMISPETIVEKIRQYGEWCK